jgi:hypothetical protein
MILLLLNTKKVTSECERELKMILNFLVTSFMDDPYLGGDTPLNIADRQTDEQVHEDDADQHGEDEDHGVSGEGVERLAVLVDEVLVLDLTGHHHQSLDNCRGNVDVKALQIKKFFRAKVRFSG